MLEVLLSSERKPAEKEKILKENFDFKMTEDLEREVSSMCNLSEGVEKKGIEKGREEGILEATKHSIETIMKLSKMTRIQAMKALDIPEEEWDKYLSADELKEINNKN
jgi:predicted transposase YdaD